MKTKPIRALGATLGGLFACATLATAFTPTIPPQITSPANGSTASTAAPLLIEVDHGDVPNVQSIEILANGSSIGWAYTTDFFGEWSYPDDAHLSVMESNWPGAPPVMLDYHPDADSPMMFFEGEFVTPTQFSGTYEINIWPNPPTGNVTIDFTRVNGKVNVVITGDGPLGVREHTGGANLQPQGTFACEWTSPNPGTQRLTAKVTFLNPDTMDEEVMTTGAVQVTVSAPAAPEITIEQPEGTVLVSGQGTVSLPNVLMGGKSPAQVFTIRNVGNAALTGLGITKTGANSAEFTVSALPVRQLAAGESTQFTVVFKPTAKGAREAVLQVASNDADEDPFVLNLAGNASTAPEINVQYKGRGLKDNKSSANFGKVVRRSKSKAYAYTVRNDGSAPLKNLKVLVKGAQKRHFIVTQPRKSKLKPGQKTTFKVRFAPRKTGARKAQLRILSNDADENPFRVAIQGKGIIGAIRN